MGLSKEDRRADREIAEVVNELQYLQLEKCTKKNDKEMKGLIEKLNYFSKECNKRVRTHISEIQDCLYGVVDWYKEFKKTPPRISIVYL